MMEFVLERLFYIKGENACCQHFLLLFPHVFMFYFFQRGCVRGGKEGERAFHENFGMCAKELAFEEGFVTYVEDSVSQDQTEKKPLCLILDQNCWLLSHLLRLYL